jgi:hypothetical protein
MFMARRGTNAVEAGGDHEEGLEVTQQVLVPDWNYPCSTRSQPSGISLSCGRKRLL